MKIDVSIVIFSMINFVIIVLFAKHFFFDKVQNVIEEREIAIKDSIDKAEDDAEKARVLLLENQKALQTARVEGNKIVEEKKQKADKIYDEIVEEANAEAKAILERTTVEISREKEKAQHEIKTQVVDLAMLISAKALEESIDDEKHRALINDFIAKVGI